MMASHPQSAAYYSYNYNGAYYPSPRRVDSDQKAPESCSPDGKGGKDGERASEKASSPKTVVEDEEIEPPRLVRKANTDDNQTHATADTEAVSSNSSG